MSRELIVYLHPWCYDPWAELETRSQTYWEEGCEGFPAKPDGWCVYVQGRTEGREDEEPSLTADLDDYAEAWNLAEILQAHYGADEIREY